MKNKIIRIMLITTMILILIDQTSKIIVKQNYKNSDPNSNKIIEIMLIENTGMAFGFNEGNTKNIILTSLILLIVINFIVKQKDRIDTKTAIALSMVLAGGMSNLIDRITKGGIIDFIKIAKFPIFNMADCYIVIGWILIVIFLIKFNQKIVEVEDCEKQ